MANIIFLIQIIVSLLLIVVILIQSKGTGLSSSFGKGNLFTAKRGVEKFLFIAAIILAALFLFLAIVNTLLGLK